MKTIIHKAASRGHMDHGWLKTWHTFSFAEYRDPERIRFGALRVLNDDIVAQGQGFGRHPHDNMEIITIPLHGALEHQDSMGNSSVIRAGEVQLMSAGTGIFHSEFNHSREEEVRLLQIWVFPNEKNVKPRYAQEEFTIADRKNRWQRIVSPKGEGEMWIHQNAFFQLIQLGKDRSAGYDINLKGNGIYLFVIEGKAETEGISLSRRDGLGIWETPSIQIKANEDSHLLLMEVPMEI